jgi:hypothetical protein
MTGPEPRIEIDVRGTMVGFLRRDIRQLADDERIRVDRLVERVRREADPDQTVVRIVIETDYPDADRLSYTASYRVQIVGRGPDGDAD